MTGRQRRQLNHFFVETFNNILLYEEQALSDAGSGKLSVKELHVLAAVGLLEAEGQNTMTRIAAALNITVGALTTAVNTLIRKGYLARVADQSDRRLVRVVLTESGRLADARHSAFHEDMLDHVAEILTEADVETLTRSLDRLSAFFESAAQKQTTGEAP